MQPAQQQPHDYSPEEYLQLEELAEYKSEYHDGEILPMTGGTTNHNQITGNFYAALKYSNKRKGYRVFITEVKLWIPQIRRFTYPDVMITNGQPNYFENRRDTITNPLIIVEVLSQSTKDYDRGDKFEYYRTLPSFQEYILVSQFKVHVEHFVKTNEHQWLLSEYAQLEAKLELNTIPVIITLADIYDEVNFEESNLDGA
ncbi:MAG: Uma2 family endonuclease [Thioploca sp.]|nr:Uma2 family endonuclease [Thioploca sp.]